MFKGCHFPSEVIISPINSVIVKSKRYS